jgi:phosphate transport system permease protein
MALGRVLDRKTAARVEKRLYGRRADPASIAFRAVLSACLLFALSVLAVLLVDVVVGGWDVLSGRLSSFLGTGLRTRPNEAGVFQGLRGTFWISVCVALVAFPIGIGAALYLEEYAPDNRFTRFIDLNIRNLAGVPSVVYGILGFTIFVKLLDGFFPRSLADHGGRTTLAAGVTLAVLALPIVIITSAEAVRAVPQSLREAGYGVGATKWEVIRSHVLPYAAPGILTGTLLSMARAIGEAAPLILVGAVRGKLGSRSGVLDVNQLGEKFTAMPIVITEFASRPGRDWEAVTAAAIVVLLVAVLLANAAAILLRNHFENKRGRL